ncbi:hypothetical protein F4776DRAFT_672456 [Hypoxylon sp. NC0597]|nr:hypothetical protein F4776DRAFT_672456 [Hypoxylon sp. NC0597]
MPRGKRFASAEELAERAERKRIRTSYRTDATDKEKARALKVATDRLPGKKYSWMNQEKLTPAKTMGKRVARECEITTGPIAEELGIGEHSTTLSEHAEGFKKAKASGLTAIEAEQLIDAYVDPKTSTPARPSASASAPAQTPAQLPTPDPSTKDDDLEALFDEDYFNGVNGVEQAKKPAAGSSKENPISLSSRESSPIIIPDEEATPTPSSKKRKATTPPKTPKQKRPAKKARVEEPKEDEERREEEEYNEEEEKEDLAMFLKSVLDFLNI